MSADSSTDNGADGAAAQLRRLAQDYLDDLALRHPDTATELGDHRFDDRLPDLGEGALEDERRGLDVFAARLGQVIAQAEGDPAGLDPELRVDAALLANDVARRLFEITELREQSWNPLRANPGQALYLLLARDFAPLPDRLHALAGRLAAVPATLAAARGGLGQMPKVHLETAIAQFDGTTGLVTEEVGKALEQAGRAGRADWAPGLAGGPPGRR